MPELWRFDGNRRSVEQLGSDGDYRTTERSPSFPAVPLDEIRRLRARRATTDETTLARGFSAWARQALPAPGDAAPGGARGPRFRAPPHEFTALRDSRCHAPASPLSWAQHRIRHRYLPR